MVLYIKFVSSAKIIYFAWSLEEEEEETKVLLLLAVLAVHICINYLSTIHDKIVLTKHKKSKWEWTFWFYLRIFINLKVFAIGNTLLNISSRSTSTTTTNTNLIRALEKFIQFSRNPFNEIFAHKIRGSINKRSIVYRSSFRL